MALKRLSRKQIVQEDRIYARLSQISQWVLRNRNYLAAAAVVLVVVIVGLWALQGYRAGQTAETQGLFSDALELYHATIDKVEEKSEEKVEGEEKVEKSAEEKAQARAQELANNRYRFQSDQERIQKAEKAFLELVQEHPDSQLGVLSRYYLALIARQTDRIEEAKEGLLWVIDNADAVDTKNLSRNALAQILLGEGSAKEAADLLEQMVEEPSPNYPQQIILMSLGQSYEKAGNRDKAIEQYKKITSEFPTSQQSQEAQSRIDELEDSKAPDDTEA